MNELMIIKTLIRRPKTIFRRTLLRCVRLMTWAVRLSSVCNVGAPYSQGWTFRKCLHRLTWELGQFVLKFLGRFKGVLDDRLSKMEGWYEKLPFLANISLYFENGTRYGHTYYQRRIGTRMRSIEWCHLEWSWVIRNLFQGHDITSRQTTKKWYKIKLICLLTTTDQYEVEYDLSMSAIFTAPWTTP